MMAGQDENDRIVFDVERLLQAFAEDCITALVYETLRPKYGEFLTFHRMVDDIARSIRLALVQIIRTHLKFNKLSASIDQKALSENEQRAKEQIESTPDYKPPWIAEGSEEPK